MHKIQVIKLGVAMAFIWSYAKRNCCSSKPGIENLFWPFFFFHFWL